MISSPMRSRSYTECLTLCNELGSKRIASESLEGLACAAVAKGEATHAARLFGAARALRETVGYQNPPERHALRVPYLTRRHGKWRSQRDALSFDEAVEYALSEERSATPATPAPDHLSAVKQSSTLTAREREVGAMVAQGMSNGQIAKDLYLSQRTIENHVSRILGKLDLASRTEIAAWATEQRLIAPNPD